MPRVVSPVTPRVPENVPLMPVRIEFTRVESVAFEEKRFVELAVVAKEVVVVALVVVEFAAVKFCSVDEAKERKPPVKVESPVTPRVLEKVPVLPVNTLDINVPIFPAVEKRLVEDAVVE